MNPWYIDALTSILRWALTIGATYFVSRGVWTQENAALYVAGAATALATLLWSLWKHYGMRIKFVTAAANAGMSEHDVEAIVKDPETPNPSVRTAKSDVPVVPEIPPLQPLPPPVEPKP